MKYVYTDGKNKDFNLLCQQLDDYLNEIVGGEKQRKQYTKYNTTEDIHDVILLYDNDLPIGCASFRYVDDKTAEIKRVFIRKEYRGKGLSKELMKNLEERAKDKHYTKLILETGAPLKEAIGLYKTTGYKVIENYGQYKEMKDSICMRKNII